MAYFTISAIKQANEALGHHWFSKDSMRFFNTRIYPHVFAGRYFITSELRPYSERAYSIREAMPDGSIETVGEFYSYDSLRQAKAAVNKLVKASGYLIVQENPEYVHERHFYIAGIQVHKSYSQDDVDDYEKYLQSYGLKLAQPCVWCDASTTNDNKVCDRCHDRDNEL